MRTLLDLDRYPLDRPDSAAYAALVAACQRELALHGTVNLDGFVSPDAIIRAAAEIVPLTGRAFTHQRAHNVYFKDHIEGLPHDHPALTRFQTIHHTLCDDQIGQTIIHRIYEWNPLASFLGKVMEQPGLCQMADPLARVNVIEYRPGETLNWHFDRSRYTTTLLIQAADAGGEFEYRSGLRSEADPNYEGVGQLLRGQDPGIRVHTLLPGTLNVFAGRNTLHRVSKVTGERSRFVAVYSYYDRPGVMFSDEERRGFYGRSA
jgi:hypothetical protein